PLAVFGRCGIFPRHARVAGCGSGVSLPGRLVLGLLLLAAAPAALAQGQGLTGSFDSDFVQRPWAEFAAHLPKFPDAADLAEIHVAGEQDTRFYIDLASVDLASDAVIRYTM